MHIPMLLVLSVSKDEQSCVVLGVPKVVIARGGAVCVSTLVALPQLIADALRNSSGVPARIVG